MPVVEERLSVLEVQMQEIGATLAGLFGLVAKLIPNP